MKYLFAAVVVVFLASCGGQANKTDNRSDNESIAASDIQRMWYIENVVVNDTLYARPGEIDPERHQSFTFSNGSFGINTNCNTLGGEYIQTGDSIVFTNIMTTEMACDNMDVEQLLLRVLPDVRTLDCLNDSIMRLNTTSSAYIVLKKAPFVEKCRQPLE